jgi:hypothetical protein
MNTQLVSEHHREINCTNAFFKTWMVSPDTICRMNEEAISLSGSPAVMSGLAIVTDALVPMVMRNELFHIYLSVFSLSSTCLFNMPNA